VVSRSETGAEMLAQFHFIQPLWLLALLPLAGVLWLLVRRGPGSSPWRRLVDARLLPLLLDGQNTRRSLLPVWLLSSAWLLAVLALANPTWEQQPQPLRQTSASRVIVLDLSRSMLVADLRPSRLVRARFKVEDILAFDPEGQTALVVFAGDAFTVAPLTRDADTIRAQLKALHPSIMPSQGSRADLGLSKAHELLRQAGVPHGQVVLIADGVEGAGASGAATRLRESGYEVSVLGVGTAAGAPLPDGRGGTLRDNTGRPLIPGLDADALAAIAEAGGGRYSPLRGDPVDLDYLLRTPGDAGDRIDSDELQAQKWKGQGPFIAVLLLPLAALAFRRGWLLVILICTGTLIPPRPALALSWEGLWQRQDQQAAQALAGGDYERAARLAEEPSRRGSAYYRQGEFDKALEDFDRVVGADGAYNRGNALARLGRYEDAITAYERALELDPDMEDAAANKAAVEALLEQQGQQQTTADRQGAQGQQSQQAQASSEDRDGAGQKGEPQPSSQSQQASAGQENTEPGSDGVQSQASAGEESPDRGDEQGQSSHKAQASSDPDGTAGRGDEAQASQQADASPGQEKGDPPGGQGRQSADTQAMSGDETDQQAEGAEIAAKTPAGNQDDAAGGQGERATDSEPRHGGAGPRSEDTGNQFAEANRRLDNAGPDAQSDTQGDASKPQPDGGRAGGARQPPGDRATARQETPRDRRQGEPNPAEPAVAEALSDEEQMAAQQWLRRIPDDPGGLLRRKFLYQYRQRGRHPDGGQEW